MSRRFLFALLTLFLLALPAPSSAAPPVRTSPAMSAPLALPLVVTPRVRRYARTRYVLYFTGTVYQWLLLWGVLASGLSGRLRDAAERRMARPFWRLAAYYAALTVVLALAQFPLVWYGGYALEHAYGLSGQGFGAWLGDLLKSDAVGFVLSVPLFALLRWLIAKSPHRWSVWLWAALVPIVAFGIFLAPVVVDPLFNTFTPLPPGPLRTRIQALAAQAGIPDAPIFVADKSRQTRTTNAYVTGLGGSARIVIWDTTLKELPDDEVVGIVAHEMGHYVLKHIVLGFAETLVGLLILLPLAQGLTRGLVMRYGPRWQVRGLTDMAAIPVFLLTLSVLGVFSDPVSNYCSRQIEHQADAYGLAATHDGPAMARAFAFFAVHDLSDPYPPPPIKFWLFSHPPLGERIAFVLGRK